MDRYVIVEARSLEDLCQLSERAVDQLRTVQPRDALLESLAGAVAEVRVHSMLEPVG